MPVYSCMPVNGCCISLCSHFVGFFYVCLSVVLSVSVGVLCLSVVVLCLFVVKLHLFAVVYVSL